jgi:predicted  nucleic acid-binding Zn-ribbon protein
MATDELQNLEDNIQRLKQQLAGKRDTLVKIAPEEEVRIKQQIEDLRRKIRYFEREKWDLIASDSQEASFPDAEVMVAEIVTELTAITTEPPDQLASPQILELLNQILAKLNQPERLAAAKLKASLSTIPPFVSLLGR